MSRMFYHFGIKSKLCVCLTTSHIMLMLADETSNYSTNVTRSKGHLLFKKSVLLFHYYNCLLISTVSKYRTELRGSVTLLLNF